MRAPKQDQFNQILCTQIDCVVAIGVGRAFRLLTGSVQEAPKWAQKLGIAGIICKREDASSLASAIERLIVDEALRNRMGEKEYRIYQEKFTLSCFEQRFTEILRKING